MKTTSSTLLLFAGAFALAACARADDPRLAAAQKVLEKNDHIFAVCKEDTETRHLAPGSHMCSMPISVALDKSLADTGLGEAKITEMRDEWLEKKGYKPFYVAGDKRKPAH